MKPETRQRLCTAAVWLCRIIVGATFAISGWAKAIDPIGFVLKAGEYLSVWNLTVPHEAIVAGCITLACVEFTTGVLILTGSMKRIAVLVAAALMAFMLPLTFYILLTNPVSDCGCFGELWHISNGTTFTKNVVLVGLIIYLFIRNRRVAGLFPAPVQWLEITLCVAFPLTLALAGYQIQPLLDFRPYKTGTEIFAGDADNENEEYFTYTKNGVTQRFTLDRLPDSTWTYVETPLESSPSFDGGITVRDLDGYDVTDNLVSSSGRTLFIIVPEPGMHYLISAHYINRLEDYCRRNSVDVIAILGGGESRITKWLDWCRPDFDVYTADATALKQLARGPEALVFTDDGIIKWKRTLSSMPNDLPDTTHSKALDELSPIDDGTYHLWLLIIFIAGLAGVYLLGQSPKIIKKLLEIGFGHHSSTQDTP